jgi:hypothetical protein
MSHGNRTHAGNGWRTFPFRGGILKARFGAPPGPGSNHRW